jgi:predicted AAA+ superfamily ATPase
MASTEITLETFIRNALVGKEDYIIIIAPRRFGKSTAIKSISNDFKEWQFLDDPFFNNTEIIANDVITRKTCIVATPWDSMFDFLRTEIGSKFTCKNFPINW